MDSYTICLAGNPNVGKSTVFNALTGMHQHTGNWTGKTVASAKGDFYFNDVHFTIVDIPGMYSLFSSSTDERVARDYIIFEKPDCIVVVADATCLERNLNLVLQILEVTDRVVLCINLMDEAKRKGLEVDIDELSLQLGIPVVATSARSGKGLDALIKCIYSMTVENKKTYFSPTKYNEKIEKTIGTLSDNNLLLSANINARWLSLRLLDGDDSLYHALKEKGGFDAYCEQIDNAKKSTLELCGLNAQSNEALRDMIAYGIIKRAENIYKLCTHVNSSNYNALDRKLDKIFTSRLTGIPIMLLLLCILFWITIVGANYPSQWLSCLFNTIEKGLFDGLSALGTPTWLRDCLVCGVFRTLAWVTAVMLPPMAIFFPLFTLLEDLGYLPRVAFNLDKYFKKSGAHGKQALTICMGLGCNACGVTGCRIIESPRERLIAIITNCFMPCNGRFPTIIALITIFFASTAGFFSSLIQALFLGGLILLGVAVTLGISRILSKTLLKGESSSFVLELPPYRIPQFGKVVVRSVFDRTLFVLGRAAAVAAPAGLIIWIFSNIYVGDCSLLIFCADAIDPFARLLGMDGVILLAFILGLPANEIVLPIIIMAYLGTGSLTNYDSLSSLGTLLTDNGWTWVTALCVMLFSLMHFPCATTCRTIYKETQSKKWTALAVIIPTITGMVICFTVNLFCVLLDF